ncbi:MAG: hypothetical protein IJA00_06260 [Bacteroidaceae bacterium]|nr:hypothetical protein [Bacteroidaceae bacterium]MBQ8191588.1 hypothetical protein [Bacteroidaceae bacterium]
MKQKHIFYILLAFFTASSKVVFAQNKFCIDIDYHYNLGLSEKISGNTLKRDFYDLGGNSLHLSTRYRITQEWSAGIGIGLDRYTDPGYNTLPIFATARYQFIKYIPDFYLFTDLGYAINAGDIFTPGFTGSLGLGYTYYTKKRFGVNLQIGYNLKTFTNVPHYHLNLATNEITYSEEEGIRHSLSLGIGITF